MKHGMTGCHPGPSRKLDEIEDPAVRAVLIPIEKERLRQNLSMLDVDGGSGSYCGAVKYGKSVNVKTLRRWMDVLGMDLVFINKEGDQV